MTDLDAPSRERLMRTVFAAEQTLRDLLRPRKINLASLGNQVPHLHWHVIARDLQDPHFPGSIWSKPLRPGSATPRAPSDAALRAHLTELLSQT